MAKKIILVVDENYGVLKAIHELIINKNLKFLPRPIKSLKDFEPGTMFRYQCQTCGNTCLQETRPDNSECQPDCTKPDWKLMINQENYKAGETDYILREGEA